MFGFPRSPSIDNFVCICVTLFRRNIGIYVNLVQLLVADGITHKFAESVLIGGFFMHKNYFYSLLPSGIISPKFCEIKYKYVGSRKQIKYFI